MVILTIIGLIHLNLITIEHKNNRLLMVIFTIIGLIHINFNYHILLACACPNLLTIKRWL